MEFDSPAGRVGHYAHDWQDWLVVRFPETIAFLEDTVKHHIDLVAGAVGLMLLGCVLTVQFSNSQEQRHRRLYAVCSGPLLAGTARLGA